MCAGLISRGIYVSPSDDEVSHATVPVDAADIPHPSVSRAHQLKFPCVSFFSHTSRQSVVSKLEWSISCPRHLRQRHTCIRHADTQRKGGSTTSVNHARETRRTRREQIETSQAARTYCMVYEVFVDVDLCKPDMVRASLHDRAGWSKDDKRSRLPPTRITQRDPAMRKRMGFRTVKS